MSSWVRLEKLDLPLELIFQLSTNESSPSCLSVGMSGLHVKICNFGCFSNKRKELANCWYNFFIASSYQQRYSSSNIKGRWIFFSKGIYSGLMCWNTYQYDLKLEYPSLEKIGSIFSKIIEFMWRPIASKKGLPSLFNSLESWPFNYCEISQLAIPWENPWILIS